MLDGQEDFDLRIEILIVNAYISSFIIPDKHELSLF